jgi:hypothetical protein
MTECNYYEVPCTRNLQSGNFAQGVQDFVFSIGAPNCWVPSKSYFRVDMSLYAAGGVSPLKPSQMTAFADNAVGNLYDNTYARAGQQDISSLVQYSAQASALDVRVNNTLPWLKSMGSSTAVNESSFMKRLQQVSANAGQNANDGPQLTRLNSYENREIFRPEPLASYGTLNVTIARAVTTAGANPQSVAPSVLTGDAGMLFTSGMPSVLTAANQASNNTPSNTGGSVLPGDIIVVQGIEYEIESVLSATQLLLATATDILGPTPDWFIVRADVIRSKQASSSVYALWQPPIGLFKYSEELGAGDYRIQLNPNSNFILNAVETRNTNYAAASPYSLVINDVRFYCYVEKRMIPDTVRDLYLTEMLVQSKPYSSNLQFSVPPSTTAITIFVQDGSVGGNPNIPPSMFRMLDNTDLNLQNIQVTYANVSKPSTNWQSNYAVAHTSAANTFNGSGTNKLEQRYHDSYEETGLEIKLGGCESFYDYLQRGPFYHFAFERDVNNKSTEVQITSVFSPNNNPTNMRLFIVAHYRKTVQITTANGLVVNVSSREV